ncbi:MAG: oligosaccharide flippase family protein, partial [Planctomycetota bacterium]
MNLSLKIMTNSLFLFTARTINPAVTVAIGIYIARSLGVEAFGQFSFILSYFFLVSMICSLGMATIVSRDTAKRPDQIAKYFSNGSFIGILSSAVGLVIMLSLAPLFNLSPEGRHALTILSLSIFASILIFIWESLLITFEKNQYITAIQGAEAIIKCVFSYIAVSRGHGLIYLMTIFMISRFISGILYYFVLRKVFYPLRVKISFEFIKKILSLVPTFAGLYMFSVVFSKIDLLMLAHLKNFSDVGIYSAAYKLLDISFMLPTCIIAVVFPVLSKYAQEDSE